MRVYSSFKEKPVARITHVLEKVVCNRCGAEVPGEEADSITPVTLDFCYGSQFDTDTWKFDICDDCIISMTEDFIIPPKKTNAARCP